MKQKTTRRFKRTLIATLAAISLLSSVTAITANAKAVNWKSGTEWECISTTKSCTTDTINIGNSKKGYSKLSRTTGKATGSQKVTTGGTATTGGTVYFHCLHKTTDGNTDKPIKKTLAKETRSSCSISTAELSSSKIVTYYYSNFIGYLGTTVGEVRVS